MISVILTALFFVVYEIYRTHSDRHDDDYSYNCVFRISYHLHFDFVIAFAVL